DVEALVGAEAAERAAPPLGRGLQIRDAGAAAAGRARPHPEPAALPADEFRGLARRDDLHSPAASLVARFSGSPCSRISACVASTSYGTRRKCACFRSKSISRYAALGSPSRGWPTEPGLSSQRPSLSSRSLPPFASPPAS